MASYARNLAEFTRAGLQLVAISVDDVDRNAAMAAKLLLPFPLLSDPSATVIKRWGVYAGDVVADLGDAAPEPGLAKPAVFVIRPDWSIAFRYVARDQVVWLDRPTDEDILSSIGGGRAWHEENRLLP